MHKTLTVRQVARLLQVPAEHVEALLDSGRLRGLNISGGWRVRQEDLTEFLETKVKEQELKVLLKALSTPELWRSVLREFPDLVSEIKAKDFPPNTFGKFIQDLMESPE